MPVYPLVCSLSCFEPLYLRDLIRNDVYYIIQRLVPVNLEPSSLKAQAGAQTKVSSSA
jgi:hypothetical protein